MEQRSEGIEGTGVTAFALVLYVVTTMSRSVEVGGGGGYWPGARQPAQWRRETSSRRCLVDKKDN